MLRTRATLQPGRPGTKKLLAQYGSRLVCVRYRYDDERQTRCKTIELVIEEIPWPPPTRPSPYRPEDLVTVILTFNEHTLRQAIKRRGGKWNPETKTWTLSYADTLALRLTDRIDARARGRRDRKAPAT